MSFMSAEGTRYKSSVLGAITAIVMVVTSGCGSEQKCTPGETQGCVCPGERRGAQSCKSDGSGWKACQCRVDMNAGQTDVAADDAGQGDGSEHTPDVVASSRSFDGVKSSGMIAPSNACGQMGTESTTAKLRFVMLADDSTAIRPESKGGTPLDSGAVNMSTDTFQFKDGSGAIFEPPDLQCEMGEVGGMKGDTSWSGAIDYFNSDECQIGSCSQTTGADEPKMRRCASQQGYEVQGVSYKSDVEKNQLFGLLLENAGSLQGQVPQGHRPWYYDDNGDGTADVSVFRGFNGKDSRATDKDNLRHGAVSSLQESWSAVRDRAQLEGRQTKFGLWTFEGDPDPTSLVEREIGDGPWTGSEEPENVDDVVQAYGNEQADSGRGNVIESVTNLLNDEGSTPFSGEAYQGAEKTLVVFADGPPELPPGRSDNATAQAAIEAANDANVRLYIVHLDAPIAGNDQSGEKASPEQILDDPKYATNQKGNCESNDSCAPHEKCREIRRYSSNGSGSVNEGPSGKYCLPRRRADGRIGPLELYSQIACATGGGYQYVKTPQDLNWVMRWLPYTMDGLWEADVSVNALRRDRYVEGGASRFSGQFDVTAGSTTRTIDLSQTGGDVEGTDTGPNSGDSRSTIFTDERLQ